MNKQKIKNQLRTKRKNRSRAKIFGTAECPRFSVFKSNRYTYVQLINDLKGETLVSASTYELLKGGKQKLTKQQQAEMLGKLIAKKAVEKNINKAVFSRGAYKYHGRVKAVAEGARKGGLKI